VSAFPRLRRRALRALREGPVHTLELARDVLGIRTGDPGAASAAVFALLSSDRRFRVDGEGRWSLARPPGEESPLRRERFAVVDVETTGGSYRRGHRITEIAVVEVGNGEPGEVFHSLVDPGRPIPHWISEMTGITDAMVSGAPSFEAIAGQVVDLLHGRVFVAHNVSFDWRFVEGHLAAAGLPVPRVPRLCTVRLARRLLPRARRRNLDAVTAHLGIEIRDRHRALGDAEATARVLLELLERAAARGIEDLQGLQRLLGS